MDRWTDEELALLNQMTADGVPITDIADRLNRTMWSVKGRIRYDRMTQEQREHKRDKLRDRYKRKRIHENAQIIESSRPSEVALRERNRRYAAPARDLTGLLLGDPRVGYAALDNHA